LAIQDELQWLSIAHQLQTLHPDAKLSK